MNCRFALAFALLVKCIGANPMIYQVGGCTVGDKTYSVGEGLPQLCPSGPGTYNAICKQGGSWDMSDRSSCNTVYPVGQGPVNQVPPQNTQVYCEVLGNQRPVGYYVYRRCPSGRYAKSYCQRDGSWTDVRAECQRPNGGIVNPRRPGGKPSQPSGGVKPNKPNGGIFQALLLQKALGGSMGNMDPYLLMTMLQGKGLNPLALYSMMGSNSDNSSSPFGNLSPSMIMQLMTGQGAGLNPLSLLNLSSGTSGTNDQSPLGNIDPNLLYQIMAQQGGGGGNVLQLQMMSQLLGGGLPGLQG